MKKVYESVTPVGYILTEGKKFLLLREWAKIEDGMYVYPVVESESGDFIPDPVDPINKALKGYNKLYLRVHSTHCAILFGYHGKPIMVFVGEYNDD